MVDRPRCRAFPRDRVTGGPRPRASVVALKGAWLALTAGSEVGAEVGADVGGDGVGGVTVWLIGGRGV